MSHWVSAVDGTALFATVAAMAVVLLLVISRLRQAHVQAWEQMGKPALFNFWGGYASRWSLFRFLFSEEHRALGDGGLSALVWAMRVLIVLAVAIVVVPIVGWRMT